MPVRRLNHAVLYVADLASAVAFYTDALGFEVHLEIPGRAAFLGAPGSANDHDLGLFERAGGAAPPENYIGLYHLGWEVGTLGALAGASDRGVSNPPNAKDPSGIEFELMWRVPAEDWAAERAGGPGIAPLDLEGEIARWGDRATGAA